jgi:preprotein translocase subunit YajC
MLNVLALFAMAAPQGGAGGQQGSWLSTLMPLVIIFAIFYLLMIRPQQKQQKKHREMVAAMKKGDQVVTRGGMHGTIYGVTDAAVTLEVAKDVRIKFSKEAIATIVQPQTETAPANNS